MRNLALRKLLVVGAFLMSVITAPAFAADKMLNYDDAWKEGKFNSESLKDVTELYPMPDTVLSEEQKQALKNSTALIHLEKLDLSHQDIDDDFIKSISDNSTFSRVRDLDLSHNLKVTNLSLEYIRNSQNLGSIMATPQISGAFGGPFSEIKITIKGTSIDLERSKNHQEPRFDFSISYTDPITDHRTAPSVTDSIKWVTCN